MFHSDQQTSMKPPEMPSKMAILQPPSYDAVQLQKHCEQLLEPTGSPLHGITQHLQGFDSSIPSTAEASEKCVWAHLTAFIEIHDAGALEYTRKVPRAMDEGMRQFLLACVARDSDVDLITLSKRENRHFVYLLTAYEWSWLHQTLYGWKDTAYEIQQLAYDIFRSFIELPLQHLGVPISAFLWHSRIHRTLYRHPQDLSLSEKPPGYTDSTLQALRNHGDLKKLEELLRMNDMILDATVDGLHQHPKIYRACKKEIAAERQAYIPPQLRCDTFQYTMVDHPAWHRFERIHCDRRPIFEPLRQPERRTGPEIEALPSSFMIEQEVEYNPWS